MTEQLPARTLFYSLRAKAINTASVEGLTGSRILSELIQTPFAPRDNRWQVISLLSIQIGLRFRWLEIVLPEFRQLRKDAFVERLGVP